MSTKQKKAEELKLITTPNRILEAVARFSVYQWRAYATIIELFEDEAKKSFADGQLAIQSFLNQQTIVLAIPLKKISKPSEYRDVKKALVAMSKTECEIPYSEKGEKRIVTGTLFTLDMPNEPNWKSTVRLHFHPEVAKLFLTFPRNHRNAPVFYSKFSPDVVRKIKNLYVIKLYFLLCLWRYRDIVYKSIDDLYQILGVGSKYPRFTDFKKHVLVPAYNILLAHGDVWFNIDDPFFYKKVGIKTIGVNFKLLTQESLATQHKKIESIKAMLINGYRFSIDDFEEIEDVLIKLPYDQIANKIIELSEKLIGNNKVDHPKRYIITALNNMKSK